MKRLIYFLPFLVIGVLQVKAQNIISNEVTIEQLQILNLTDISIDPIISNNAYLLQEGSLHSAIITQNLTSGIIGNTAVIIQKDHSNSAALLQRGSNIQSILLQKGNNNNYNVTAEGNDIYSVVEQNGGGNYVNVYLTSGYSNLNLSNRPYTISQQGANNELRLHHTTDVKPYTIEQRGNGIKMSIETASPVFK